MHISYSEVMYDNNELILYDTIFYIYIDKYTKSQMYIIVMREKRGSNVCVGCGGRWCVVCGVWCVTITLCITVTQISHVSHIK